jgi:divalent metal cation (Fe/Co/Zn/Cd) transporter
MRNFQQERNALNIKIAAYILLYTAAAITVSLAAIFYLAWVSREALLIGLPIIAIIFYAAVKGLREQVREIEDETLREIEQAEEAEWQQRNAEQEEHEG